MPPLAFYPNPRAALTQQAVMLACALVIVLLIWSLTRTPREIDAAAWGWALGKLAAGLACVALAARARRIARRIAHARDNGEPQLVIDRFGITLRDDLLWRKRRYAWSKIHGIDVVPDSKGVSIMIRGEFGLFGRMIDVLTDSGDPPELIESRIAGARTAPALH